MGGARRQADIHTQTGYHIGYSRGNSKNGFYNAAGELHSVVAGFDAKRTFDSGRYLRGMAGGYFGGGSNEYAFHSQYGSSLHGRSDSAATGYYGAVYGGQTDMFAAGGSRTKEIGLVGLSLNLSPDVSWDLQGSALPGYMMQIDDSYRSLYAGATLSFDDERPVSNGTACRYFKVGARWRIAGNALEMKLLGVPLSGKAREDSAVVTLEAGFRLKGTDEWEPELSFGSTFSKNISSYTASATLTRRF